MQDSSRRVPLAFIDEFPPRMAAIICRCCTYNARDRPTASEVVALLEDGDRDGDDDSKYPEAVDAEMGIAPGEVLHVGNRLRDDLALAKQAGMKTALYAGDKSSLEATKQELKDPHIKPDRLLTDLRQIRQVLQIG